MSHSALPLIGSTAAVAAAAAVAYVAYDYQTCHPMRKMHGYSPSGAWIRFHNTMRPEATYSRMELKDLSARYNGQGGQPTYFSSEGRIWDVSDSEHFRDTYSLWKGKDASVALAKMSMSNEDVNRTDWESLTEEDMESLHSWTKYFEQRYLVKGKLTEWEEFEQKHKRK